MEKITYKEGSLIHNENDIANTLDLVTSGRVEILSSDIRINAERGSILGLLEHPEENYSHSYIAKEDCTVESYPFHSLSDVDLIVRNCREESDVLVSANGAITLSLLGLYKRSCRRSDALHRAIVKGYADYRSLCEEHDMQIQAWPLATELERFQPEQELPEWLGDFYDQLGLMPSEIKKAFYSTHSSLATTAILESVNHDQQILTLFEQLTNYNNELQERYTPSADLFDLYLNLRKNGKGNTALLSRIDVLVEDYDRTIRKTGLLSPSVIDNRRKVYEEAIIADPLLSTPEEEDDELPPETDVSPEDSTPYPFPFSLSVLDHSLEQILSYTGPAKEERERFTELVNMYKTVKDKNSSDNLVRRLRKDLAVGFYELYEAALLKALESAMSVPTPVRLFLYFGYMDEELLDEENCLRLLKLLKQVENEKYEETHIYTAFDWLTSIFTGQNDPSRNEYDQDYSGWLRSRRQSGDINEKQEKLLLESPRERLHFEINNFFRLGMRIASGYPASFCPILSSHNIVRSLEQTYISGREVLENWNMIRKTDFSLFYREALFGNPVHHIPRERIQMEVLPNVILLPMIGSRGGLWQVISGVRRDTPARIFLPVFSTEETATLQIRLAAQFRWQLCRRIQGARWNDIFEPSLTSEYCDYLQFYKKNPDLSADAKEKLKSEIQMCKSSFENVFILDYVQWIRCESLGLPRLNKVAKRILFRYCPFSAEIRQTLSSNPLYTELIQRHETQAAKKKRTLEQKYNKLKLTTGKLPLEFVDHILFYDK